MSSAMKAAMSTLFDKYMLNGSNFIDWLRNVRIVLRTESFLHVLDDPIPKAPSIDAPRELHNAYNKYMSQQAQVQGILLASMGSESQCQYEDMNPKDIIMHLRELYGQETRIECYRIASALFACRMKEGQSVAQHVQKMYGYIERLHKLGYVMDNELYIDLILHSLPSTFSHFVMNFNMNKLEVTVPELYNMLKTA